MDLTFGPLPAPDVSYNPISKEFWLTWTAEREHVDVVLTNRDELCALIRKLLEARAESYRETNTQSEARV
jgi:hypothetical protein